MNLIESAKQNLQSFETTISSVMDGSYCEEAEIAMALNPDGKLYRLRRFIGE